MACEKPDTHSRLPNDNSFIPLDPRSLNLGRMGGQRISVCPGPRRGQKQNWNVHATHSLSSPVFQTQGKAPASRQSDPGLPLEHQRPERDGNWPEPGPSCMSWLSARSALANSSSPTMGPISACILPAPPPRSPRHRGWQGKDKGRRQPHPAVSPASVYPATCVSC